MSNFFHNVNEVFSTWNYDSPRIIYAFARALKPHSLLDCGTYRGLSAAWMARACQENNMGKVHSLDDWSLMEHAHILGDKTPKQHCIENLEKLGVREWVEFHDGDSKDLSLWPEKVDFAYLDAWHSYDAARFEFEECAKRGATFIALDDTENCVGPRMLVDRLAGDLRCMDSYQQLDLHSDNGLTIFLKRQPRRNITFSQELPYPNPGVDLRPLTIAEQRAHFAEASSVTGLDYTPVFDLTDHDLVV